MTQWDRAALVDIELESGTAVRVQSPMRISFDIQKSLGKQLNAIKVSVWNLNRDHRAQIKQKNAHIRLMAGYNAGAGLELLFSGDSQYVLHAHEPPDIITQLECQDGAKALRETQISLSLNEGVTGQKVLDSIAQKFGFPLTSKTKITGAYVGGFAFHGPARAALDSVTRRFGLTWSIQNGSIQITLRGGENGTAPVPLSSTTGLIGAPERVYYTQGQVDGDLKAHASLGKATKKETEIVATGYRLTSLLLPKAIPGGTIELGTLEIKGTFKIQSVHHTGDTRGKEWFSDLEVIER